MAKDETISDKKEIVFCDGDIGYGGIVEHINDGVVIIKDGKIVFANKAFCEICRKPLKDILESTFSELIAPSDREAVRGFCAERSTADGLPDRIELTMVRPGLDALVEMKVNTIQCAGVPAILAALTDITERRKTRLELQITKDRLASILDSMNDVVVSISPKDHSILGINPSAEALYGIPVRDFGRGKKHVMDFVHPTDLEKVKEYYASLPAREFAELEYRIISKNRTVKWVLDQGRVVYGENGRLRRLDHVIRDITEEKRALDALKQSEEKYRNFFETTNDMAYAVTPEGIFMDINEAGLKLLGFESKEEALRTNIKETYVDPSEREDLLVEMKEKGFVAGKRVRLKNKAGEAFEMAITARAKMNDAGELLYYEGLAHNITKALEDQRNRVLRNAAGGMCHYLNTHLAALLVSRECMKEDLKSLEGLAQLFANGGSSGELLKPMREILVSLKESYDGVGDAYEKIAQVTKAFNSAFLTYKEESYLDKTILDIFQVYMGEGSTGEKKG
jgi:PAS domain S-box-containing protein